MCSKPSLILTGKNAGDWYLDRLNSFLKVGQKSSEAYHVMSIDFEPINELLPYRMQEAAVLLEPYFMEVEKQKQPYILANITLHEAIPYFSFEPKYFISIEKILKEELKLKSYEKIAVLGTSYTMNHSYISSFFTTNEVVQLPKALEEKVEQLRKTYYQSKDTEMAKVIFNELKQQKGLSYVIACTELALALHGSSVDLETIHLPFLQCNQLSHQFLHEEEALRKKT